LGRHWINMGVFHLVLDFLLLVVEEEWRLEFLPAVVEVGLHWGLVEVQRCIEHHRHLERHLELVELQHCIVLVGLLILQRVEGVEQLILPLVEGVGQLILRVLEVVELLIQRVVVVQHHQIRQVLEVVVQQILRVVVAVEHQILRVVVEVEQLILRVVVVVAQHLLLLVVDLLHLLLHKLDVSVFVLGVVLRVAETTRRLSSAFLLHQLVDEWTDGIPCKYLGSLRKKEWALVCQCSQRMI
jgi:hypothetical protein